MAANIYHLLSLLSETFHPLVAFPSVVFTFLSQNEAQYKKKTHKTIKISPQFKPGMLHNTQVAYVIEYSCFAVCTWILCHDLCKHTNVWWRRTGVWRAVCCRQTNTLLATTAKCQDVWDLRWVFIFFALALVCRTCLVFLGPRYLRLFQPQF